MHHEVTGPEGAPVVVLSNSLGSTLEMWDAQAEELAEHFRVVRYDTRGHGRSPVPDGPYTIDDLTDDVVALLDGLGDRARTWSASPLGGMTAMRLAARNPERVDRVVVLCTGARLEPSSAWHDRAATVRAGGSGAVAEAVVARWFTAAHLDAHPDVKRASEAMVAGTPAEGYAGCCEVIAEMDLRPDLPSITAPLLAIAGADDPATPPPHLAAIADAVAEAHLPSYPTRPTWPTPSSRAPSRPRSSNTSPETSHEPGQDRRHARRGRRRHRRRGRASPSAGSDSSASRGT